MLENYVLSVFFNQVESWNYSAHCESALFNINKAILCLLSATSPSHVQLIKAIKTQTASSLCLIVLPHLVSQSSRSSSRLAEDPESEMTEAPLWLPVTVMILFQAPSLIFSPPAVC